MDLTFIYNKEFQNRDVLCFVRQDKSYGKVYRELMKSFVDDHLHASSITTLCEYKNAADLYVDLKRYSISDYSEEDLRIFESCIDVPEISRKERIFRGGLDYYKSYDLLISATKYFIELFKTGKYKIVVSQAIDNYIGYVMMKVAQYYKIPVLGVILFFYKGYIRITICGEHNHLRTPDEDEVRSVYDRLRNKEKSVFKMNRAHVYREVARQFVNYKIKYLYHYVLLYKILGNLEYDYIGTPYFEYPRKLKNFFPQKYFEKDLSEVSKYPADKNVYIPMHFFPESTVEFWVDDPSTSPYYPSLYKTVQTLSNKGYNVFIKEHPAFFLKRDIKVYRTLKSIKNVSLIKPFISTYDVLELVDYTVVWTGTSGIEAIIQDKKTAVVSENYYSNGEISHVDNIEETKLFTEQQKMKLVERVLSNCVKIRTID